MTVASTSDHADGLLSCAGTWREVLVEKFLMISPRSSLLSTYVGDDFVDRIDDRLRGGKHYVVCRTPDRAVNASRRKLRRLFVHCNHNLRSRLEVGVRMFRFR